MLILLPFLMQNNHIYIDSYILLYYVSLSFLGFDLHEAYGTTWICFDWLIDFRDFEFCVHITM